MNNKGQVEVFYLFMMFVVFLLLGMALAPSMMNFMGEVNGVNGFDCANADDYQEKANCTTSDAIGYFFISMIFGFAGMLIYAAFRR